MCENDSFVFVVDSYSRPVYTWQLMEKNQPEISKRLVAAMLVAAAIVGVSALSMRAPAHNENALARPLKSIQTDQTILFQASAEPARCFYVERVPAMTGESKALTENLKLVAAAF